MFKGIRYFSVAVTNLDEAIERYEKLFGLQVMTPPNERVSGSYPQPWATESRVSSNSYSPQATTATWGGL